MNDLFYNVPVIKQGLQECAQASAAQILHFYGIKKSLKKIKQEVPVYVNKEGIPLGTSIGHIATYLMQQGFDTKIHTTDIQIFDRSWKNLSSEQLVKELKERGKYIKHPIYTLDVFESIFDGYITFLQNGGEITFPIVDEKYIVNLLGEGPIYAVVSYNFLNDVSKYKYLKEENKYEQDAIQGNPTTHAIIIGGYKDHRFYIIDPDYDFGGKKWIDAGILIGAFYSAQTDYDSVLISLKTS